MPNSQSLTWQSVPRNQIALANYSLRSIISIGDSDTYYVPEGVTNEVALDSGRDRDI
jgi:hypothetical protein